MITSHFWAERWRREVSRPLGRSWPSDDDDDDGVGDDGGNGNGDGVVMMMEMMEMMEMVKEERWGVGTS